MDLSQVPLNEYGHVQTRDGRPVRLLCRDLQGDRYIFIVRDERNGEFYTADRNPDFIPVPRKVRVKGWINVYIDRQDIHLWGFRADADHVACKDRIACICIDREVTEGEGLS